MKAITLWQPWATWIARGWKTIETRRHNCFASLVGQRFAIHAGLKYDHDAFDLAAAWWNNGVVWSEALTAKYPPGAVVATAVCAEARRLVDADSGPSLCAAAGLYGLVLADVVPLDPLPSASGKQGIWEWDAGEEVLA